MFAILNESVYIVGIVSEKKDSLRFSSLGFLKQSMIEKQLIIL